MFKIKDYIKFTLTKRKLVARLQKEKDDRYRDLLCAEDTIEDLKRDIKRLERVIKEKEACDLNGGTLATDWRDESLIFELNSFR